MGLRNYPNCSCGLGEETNVHIICECPKFILLRHRTLGVMRFNTTSRRIPKLGPLTLTKSIYLSQRSITIFSCFYRSRMWMWMWTLLANCGKIYVKLSFKFRCLFCLKNMSKCKIFIITFWTRRTSTFTKRDRREVYLIRQWSILTIKIVSMKATQTTLWVTLYFAFIDF